MVSSSGTSWFARVKRRLLEQFVMQRLRPEKF
jgi:hypothetical protein